MNYINFIRYNKAIEISPDEMYFYNKGLVLEKLNLKYEALERFRNIII